TERDNQLKDIPFMQNNGRDKNPDDGYRPDNSFRCSGGPSAEYTNRPFPSIWSAMVPRGPIGGGGARKALPRPTQDLTPVRSVPVHRLLSANSSIGFQHQHNRTSQFLSSIVPSTESECRTQFRYALTACRAKI
ncbi:unnamed protein product, partial [Nesidiocoris tenuis]